MFKKNQIWKDRAGRPSFRVVFVQPESWDEMHVQFFIDGKANDYVYQDVSVSDFEKLVTKRGFRLGTEIWDREEEKFCG